eukprot:c6451_g1_i1 orf=80-358(-)
MLVSLNRNKTSCQVNGKNKYNIMCLQLGLIKYNVLMSKQAYFMLISGLFKYDEHQLSWKSKELAHYHVAATWTASFHKFCMFAKPCHVHNRQ